MPIISYKGQRSSFIIKNNHTIYRILYNINFEHTGRQSMEFQIKRMNFSQTKRRHLRQMAIQSHRSQPPPLQEVIQSHLSPQNLPILKAIVTDEKQEHGIIQKLLSQEYEIDDYPQLKQTLMDGDIESQISIYEAVIGLRVILEQCVERDLLQSLALDFLNEQFIEALTRSMKKTCPHIQMEGLKILTILSLLQNFKEFISINQRILDICDFVVDTSHPQIHINVTWLVGNSIISSKHILLQQTSTFIQILKFANKFQHWQVKQSVLWLSCVYLSKLDHNQSKISQSPLSQVVPHIIGFILPFDKTFSLVPYFLKFNLHIEQFICSWIHLAESFYDIGLPHFIQYYPQLFILWKSVSVYEMVLIVRLVGVICYNSNEQQKILVNAGLLSYCQFTISTIYSNFQYLPLSKVMANQAKNNKGNQSVILVQEVCWLLSNIAANRQTGIKIINFSHIIDILFQLFKQIVIFFLELGIGEQAGETSALLYGFQSLMQKSSTLLKNTIWFFTNLFQLDLNIKNCQSFFELLGKLKVFINRIGVTKKQLLGLTQIGNEISKCLVEPRLFPYTQKYQLNGFAKIQALP